jgi:hypothetical protein
MQLDTIVRYHARQGQEEIIVSAMREAAPDVRAESGCLGIEYSSTRDPRLFYIHSPAATKPRSKCTPICLTRRLFDQAARDRPRLAARRVMDGF